MGIHGIEYGHEHERLEQLLRSVNSPGDYCVGGRLFAPMPRVLVDGAGELSFPIPDAQIQALIAAAERAPYGKGTETLVDTSVRDCWQIDAGQVRLAGRAWPDTFAKVMGLVAEGLGLPAERLDAELYKLLIYRPGGFFAEHRDTEKVPGMVGTLSLSLPTPGAGGELVVRHGGREEVFGLSAREPSELSFAAFYADCLHEVRPLAQGHRVTLVFSLFLGSSGDPPGAPDASDLAAAVAECLVRWREEGVTDKLVWLLDHEYSEGGLSFDTLKNADAAVAQVLAEAADRADCELHAAVLRIEEVGAPRFEPPTHGWDWGFDWEWEADEVVGRETDMGDVHDRWEALDGWVARDGGHPPFGEIPLNGLELLPQGALDDAEPDGRRLTGSTGNTGPTLEFLYRLTALVIWPRELTVDIVASGSIDRAVAWVETQCARVGHGVDGDGGGEDDDGSAGVGARTGDGPSEQVREMFGTLTGLWPVGEDAREEQDRAAMLRLLGNTGEGEIAADFLDRVVMANYDGSENEALAAVLPVIGPAEAGEILPWFVKEHLPRRFGDVVGLLVLATEECIGSRSTSDVADPAGGVADPGTGVAEPASNGAWRRVLRAAVAAALSGLGAALRTESEMRPGEDDGWPPGRWLRSPTRAGRAPHEEWIDHTAVCDLLVLANRLGLDDEAEAAADAIGDHPDIVTPDRMLPAALELMHTQGTLASTAAYDALWRQATDFLLERSSTVPVEPTDWTIGADIPCECELCARLRAFCEDPWKRVERFKVRKDLREHLHRVIDRRRLSMHLKTERRGSPHTLVCTKNRAGHERRLQEYAQDLRCMGTLLMAMPEGGEVATGRAERLAEALERGGE